MVEAELGDGDAAVGEDVGDRSQGVVGPEGRQPAVAAPGVRADLAGERDAAPDVGSAGSHLPRQDDAAKSRLAARVVPARVRLAVG